MTDLGSWAEFGSASTDLEVAGRCLVVVGTIASTVLGGVLGVP